MTVDSGTRSTTWGELLHQGDAARRRRAAPRSLNRDGVTRSTPPITPVDDIFVSVAATSSNHPPSGCRDPASPRSHRAGETPSPAERN